MEDDFRASLLKAAKAAAVSSPPNADIPLDQTSFVKSITLNASAISALDMNLADVAASTMHTIASPDGAKVGSRKVYAVMAFVISEYGAIERPSATGPKPKSSFL
ncbi:hypothetical protein [Sphingomonas bacterium]|uniref:hypothetical protein n=1 Tax=Sphingomonas bacterium TaxID=1895847 RepID=UPI0015767305|nr:hypothetical protein [Sphingomonas bacterium]